MSTITTSCTNGVSFGYVHTVTAQDQTDGEVIIDFNAPYMMAAVVMISNPSDADPNTTRPLLADVDAEFSYPANGQIRVANGDSLFTLTAGQVIHVVAQRRSL